MTYLSCPVPGCTHYFYHRDTLNRHLQEYHSLSQGSGFYEAKQEVPNSSDPKAPIHLINSLKNELRNTKRDPIQANIPLTPPQKQDISPIHPWSKNADNVYTLQVVINQKINPFSTVVDMVKGRLTSDKGTITHHHYEKNTSEIVSLSEKLKTLDDKSQGYVYTDHAFLSIIEQMQKTKDRIKELTEQTPADEELSTILEKYFHGEPNSESCDQFKTQFMQDSIKEVERLSNNLKRDKEAEEVNKFQK